MTSNLNIDQIVDGWISEYSTDPGLVKQRDMKYWDILDELIYNKPLYAMDVIFEFSKRKLSDWVFEGVSVGPLRTLLILYDNDELRARVAGLLEVSPAFQEMYSLARDGM